MAATYQDSYSTVVGYFSSEQQAEAAVRALDAAGFSRSQIGVAARPDTEGFTTEDDRTSGKPGFWHRIRNFFEGEPTEPYADETARGEVTDYDSSEFHRSLGQMSVPEERSRYFTQRFDRDANGILLTVQAGDRRAEAEAILQDNGADLGQETTASAASSPSAEAGASLPQAQRMQLYGEVLRVHRDRVQRGEVRLRKETVTENQTVNVPVTREELVVERVPVSGERPAPGAEIGSESEVRVPLAEDRVSIEKQPVVREEVKIGKREVTDTQSRDETLRREELRVDDETKQRKAS